MTEKHASHCGNGRFMTSHLVPLLYPPPLPSLRQLYTAPQPSPGSTSQATSAAPHHSCPFIILVVLLLHKPLLSLVKKRLQLSLAHHLYQNQTQNNPSTLKSEKLIRPSSKLTSKNGSLAANWAAFVILILLSK